MDKTKDVSEVTVAATLQVNTSVVSNHDDHDDGDDGTLHFKVIVPNEATVTCGAYLPKIELQVKDSEDNDKKDFSEYVNVEMSATDFDVLLDNDSNNDATERVSCSGRRLFFKMNEEELGCLELDTRLILTPKHSDGTSLGSDHVNKGRVVRITVTLFLAKETEGSYVRTDPIGSPQSFNVKVIPGPPARLDLFKTKNVTGKRPLSQSSQGLSHPLPHPSPLLPHPLHTNHTRT